MYNAPYQGVANQLAGYGRYGDSQLVHMNPIEVQMLSRLSPTGQLTVNPMTGQKEAFLPFLAPLLGSFLGSSLLTGAGAGVLGAAGLSSAAAGAIGSGLATAAATGDLEQGILSGITGFGLGQAFGAAGDALSKAGADTVTNTATQGATDVATKAAQTITPTGVGDISLGAGMGGGPSMGSMGTASMESFLPVSDQLDLISQGLQAPLTSTGTTAAAVPTARDLTVSQRLSAPFQEPGAFLGQLASPGTFLPAYVGETGRMAREMEQAGRGSMREYEEQQAAERRKTLAQMGNVFNQVRQAYPGVGYAQGGYVDSYAVGGGVENAIRQAAEQAGYGGEYGNFSGSLPYDIPDPKNVQLSLRGSEYVPPPAASYAALDVGGQGYLPGVSGEFQYFREPPPPPPAAIDPGSLPGGGNIAGGGGTYGGGGFNLSDFLANFRRFGGESDTSTKPIDFSGIEERLAAIENRPQPEFDYSRIPSYTPPDLSGIEERLASIEQRPQQEFDYSRMPSYTPPDFSGIEERLAAIEGRKQPEFDYSRIPSYTPPDLSGIESRLASIEGRKQPEFDYSRIPSYTPPDLSGLETRLGGLESRLQNLPAPVVNVPTPDFSPIQQQITELQSGLGALQQRPQPTFDTSALEQRLAAIEGRAVPQVSFDPIMERISSLEKMIAASRAPAQENRMSASPKDVYLPSDFEFGFAEGGMTESEAPKNTADDIVSMTVAAIRGEVENADEIIKTFVEQYGPEVFMQLREQVLQDIVPGAQTNGMVRGDGGGQDDQVEGMIGTQRPVAVSPGEYIIPADVVSLAGGGYSGDGAKFFDGLIDDIRQKTMGTTEQVKPYR